MKAKSLKPLIYSTLAAIIIAVIPIVVKHYLDKEPLPPIPKVTEEKPGEVEIRQTVIGSPGSTVSKTITITP